MVLLALLLTLSAVAQAALYVEGFLGGTAAGNLGGSSFHQTDLPPPPPSIPPPPPQTIPDNIASNLSLGNSGAVAPALVGGGRVGIWFVPEGVLGLNYPNWMKYSAFIPI